MLFLLPLPDLKNGGCVEGFYFIGVPNHSEFELSADIIAKADALSREIVSINNNLTCELRAIAATKDQVYSSLRALRGVGARKARLVYP
jgi:hypothetical protein